MDNCFKIVKLTTKIYLRLRNSVGTCLFSVSFGEKFNRLSRNKKLVIKLNNSVMYCKINQGLRKNKIGAFSELQEQDSLPKVK